MKKLTLTIIASIAFTAGIFAEESNVISFENEISTEVVSISNGTVEFTGITEQVTAKINTEKVDSGVSLITSFEKDNNDNYGFTGYEVDSAYIEFRPVDFLSLTFNRSFFTEGSYLHVADDNIANGNLTSDFSLVLRPIENLSVAAGIKLPSIFADVPEKIDLDAGIDYTNDSFSVGAVVRSPINNFGFGIFGSYKGLENFTTNIGFSYNDEFNGVAGNLLVLGTTYEVSIFAIGFDFVTNFGNTGNDLYTAVCVESGITDELALTTQASLNLDFEDSTAAETIAQVDVSYTIGNHSIAAGIAVDITDQVGVSFPVYYKYSF